MGILSLPNELLLSIAADLPVKELYRFLATCRRLSSLLTPHFHKLALQDVGSFTALQWAARYGHASLAELVLSKGTGGGADNGKRKLLTPLHLAASYDHLDVIRVLTKHGEQLTARTPWLDTPLHMAALQGSAQAIRVLLELGADFTTKGRRGRTPVHISAGRGDIDSMRAFIDAGLDFHLEDEMGRTVLHEAVLRNEVGMVEFLLGNGGERIIDVQDAAGKTPLHWTVSGRTADTEIVWLLCRHGANTEVTDIMGDTPFGLAMDRGEVWLTRELLECIASAPNRKGICKA